MIVLMDESYDSDDACRSHETSERINDLDALSRYRNLEVAFRDYR